MNFLDSESKNKQQSLSALEQKITEAEKQAKQTQENLNQKNQTYSKLENQVSDKELEEDILIKQVKETNLQLVEKELKLSSIEQDIVKRELELKKIGDSFKEQEKQQKIALGHDYYNFALDFYNNESFEKAEYLLTKSVKLDPNNGPANNLLGLVYSIQKNNSKATEYLGKSLELEPENSTFYHNLGVHHTNLNNPRGAMQAYEKAIALDQKQTSSYYNLANILSNTNSDLDKKRAAAYYRTFLGMGGHKNIDSKGVENKIAILEKDLSKIKNNWIMFRD